MVFCSVGAGQVGSSRSDPVEVMAGVAFQGDWTRAWGSGRGCSQNRGQGLVSSGQPPPSLNQCPLGCGHFYSRGLDPGVSVRPPSWGSRHCWCRTAGLWGGGGRSLTLWGLLASPQYVRLSQDTPSSLIYHLMTQHWGLDVPNLLISVTGGAKDFNMKPRLKSVFRRGLVKVAQTTGSTGAGGPRAQTTGGAQAWEWWAGGERPWEARPGPGGGGVCPVRLTPRRPPLCLACAWRPTQLWLALH